MSTPAPDSSGSAASGAAATAPGATTTTATPTPTATTTSSVSKIAKEVSHYVVTAHPPGGVLFTCKGHFVATHDKIRNNDVFVAKSRRLELRTWQSSEHTASSATTTPGVGVGNNTNGGGDASHNGSDSSEKTSLFPVLASVPINGRLTSLETLRISSAPIDFVFCTTERHQYAVLSYSAAAANSNTSGGGGGGPYPFITHASGRLPSGEDPQLLGRASESGPMIAMDPHYRCVAMHWLDGLITIIPIDQNYQYVAPTNQKSDDPNNTNNTAESKLPAYWPKSNNAGSGGGASSSVYAGGNHNHNHKASCLKEPFHVRMEERTLLNMCFLDTPADQPPQLTLLHQDSRGIQHVYTHAIDLRKHSFSQGPLKRSRVDGGSSALIPVPATRPIVATTAAAAANMPAGGTDAAAAAADGSAPPTMMTLGGVIVLGQRQITYANATTTKVTPVPPCLFLSWDALPDDPKGMPRYLLADELGNLHMISFLTYHSRIVALTLETLGSCALCHSCQYLGDGLTFVGSSLGDSQLVQIHEEPIRQDGGGGGGGGTYGGAANTSGSAEDEPSVANTEDATATDMEWMMDSTYLTVVEEYTHLGPIVDFDLVPTAPGLSANSSSAQAQPSQVVTASGTSRAGSIRLIRNGIGMNEYASVEMPGIQAMWSVREAYTSRQDAYLVQSFVGQTRVLGVTTVEADEDAEPIEEDREEEDDDEEAGGTLEEVMLDGLEANATTLYVGNVQTGNGLLQITEDEVRLISLPNKESGTVGVVLDSWTPPDASLGDRPITVATGNEAGQAVVATRGGTLWYLGVDENGTKLESLYHKQMDREVSCLDVHPFASRNPYGYESAGGDSMQIDPTSGEVDRAPCPKSTMVAVGLWDDFTVRLLSLNKELVELHQIHLSTDEDEDEDDPASMSAEESAVARRHRNNMMARSLCLITLDVSSSSHHAAGTGGGHPSLNGAQGVDMLFVGLGDGTVVSFAVLEDANERISVQSKKEVCLGTQRINLIPLATEKGGTCVLATGDRPTVIYLAGVGSGATTSGNAASFNPKLCYSNVNLQVSDEDEGEHVSRSASQQSIAVNVAAPFFSSLLFDAGSLGSQYYSLCVADDSNLRLGVIDDIQKLHVTTCRLGMAPRRIVHCPEGRMFAVGCIESGIKQFGLGGEEHNMGNCIRFLDDTTFDDIERYVLFFTLR